MNYRTLSISQDISRPRIFLSTFCINLVSVAAGVGAVPFYYCQPVFHSRAEGNKVRWFLFLIEKFRRYRKCAIDIKYVCAASTANGCGGKWKRSRERKKKSSTSSSKIFLAFSLAVAVADFSITRENRICKLIDSPSMKFFWQSPSPPT